MPRPILMACLAALASFALGCLDEGGDNEEGGFLNPSLCAGIDCSGVGRCIEEGFEARCECPTGYLADGLACLEDFDQDALPDTEEADLARFLSPRLVFSREERHPERLSHWSVHFDRATLRASVFYALAYAMDGGDSDFGGATSHYGDTEFIVVEIQLSQNGELLDYRVFLSAHHLHTTHASAWYPLDALEFEDTEDGLHPFVWVAAGKHANYASEGSCEAGAAFQDTCDAGWIEPIDIDLERHLGHAQAPLTDEVSLIVEGQVYTEHFFTEQRFCGWQIPEGGDRSDCVGLKNSYARQIAAWEQGRL